MFSSIVPSKSTIIKNFNWKEYLIANTDLIDSGIISEELALKHYYELGIRDRRPLKSKSFEWTQYIAINSDLIDRGYITKEKAEKHYIDNGYTALNTVLGQNGDAGITVKVGASAAATNAANKIFIQGTADTQPFTLAATGVTIIRGEVSTLDAFDVSSATNAQKAVAELDTLITNVAAGRAKYGAYINRLEYASDNLMNVAQNTDASRSQIEDADYAAETSELARTQIIAQASTAMLAQANQSKQSVLALLQ